MKNNFDINSLLRRNVAQLTSYSSARDEFFTDAKDHIFLDANENPYGSGLNRYPDPLQKELKAELAGQKAVDVSQLILGNGSDEILDLIFRAFCEPGIDNVITLPPTYGMYKVLAEVNDIGNREVFLDQDFQPNVQGILKAVDENTKIIFLCSPNNPTGNSITESKVKELLSNFSGLIVIDEAYMDFSPEVSWTGKLQEFPNLIITQTLSKAYGMAGIRLGIGISSEEITSLLNKIKPPYNVNSLTQQVALERVRNISTVELEIEMILKQRSILAKDLKEVKFIKKIYPSDANFLLVKVDDAPKRYAELIERGLVVRNRSSQPLCENTLRFTVGTELENKKLLQALKKIDE